MERFRVFPYVRYDFLCRQWAPYLMYLMEIFPYVRYEFFRQQWAPYLMYLMETVWVY